MNIVCPTITAENAHTYREQVERVCTFAKHIHLDLMDGKFASNQSIEPEKLWLPDNITCDVHAMYDNPESILDEVSKLSVRTFIVPAETKCDFNSLSSLVRAKNMYFGLALLAETTVESAKSAIELADHVLIFSGNLGHQGGSMADMNLLSKVDQIRSINRIAEIGWDGGINSENIAQIASSGVTVFNSGGFIHFANDPSKAYQSLVSEIS
ncbi:hypothetical protein H6800_00275 [Candidatus Nomurabacteria bacterium]|nr:hypothetical protein [Candidatus Nomurabacteria bacterium]